MPTVLQSTYFRREFVSNRVISDSGPTALCAEIAQNFGIITACIPYLKPFFDSLQSGMIRTDDLSRRGLSASYSLTALASRSIGGMGLRWPTKRSEVDRSAADSDIGRDFPLTALRPFDGRLVSSRNVVVGGGKTKRPHDADVESQRSASQMIKQTRSWVVDVAC